MFTDITDTMDVTTTILGNLLYQHDDSGPVTMSQFGISSVKSILETAKKEIVDLRAESNDRLKTLNEKIDEVQRERARAEVAETKMEKMVEYLFNRANEIVVSHKPASAVNELRKVAALLVTGS